MRAIPLTELSATTLQERTNDSSCCRTGYGHSLHVKPDHSTVNHRYDIVDIVDKVSIAHAYVVAIKGSVLVQTEDLDHINLHQLFLISELAIEYVRRKYCYTDMYR